MVLNRVFQPPNLLVATVGGLLTARDQRALVEWVREMQEIVSDVRLLVVLYRFAGWRADASFADAALWLQDDDRVSKMAVVGEAGWRLPMLTFLVQPLRRTPIEYFETEAAARRWLGVAAPDDAVPT